MTEENKEVKPRGKGIGARAMDGQLLLVALAPCLGHRNLAGTVQIVGGQAALGVLFFDAFLTTA